MEEGIHPVDGNSLFVAHRHVRTAGLAVRPLDRIFGRQSGSAVQMGNDVYWVEGDVQSATETVGGGLIPVENRTLERVDPDDVPGNPFLQVSLDSWFG